MKRIPTILVALSLLASSSVLAQTNQYGWTVSGSSTDPFMNSGTATGEVINYYLWYQCSTVEGMSAAEFDIEANGINHLATNTTNGYLNAGGASSLLLAVGGCPPGPVVAAELLVIDLPGEICIVPSAANGINGTVDCQPAPALHPNNAIGYSSQPTPLSCIEGLCQPDPVEDSSWGKVKSFYR